MFVFSAGEVRAFGITGYDFRYMRVVEEARRFLPSHRRFLLVDVSLI